MSKVLLVAIGVMLGLGALVDFASAILSLICDTIFAGAAAAAVFQLYRIMAGEIADLKAQNAALIKAAAAQAIAKRDSRS